MFDRAEAAQILEVPDIDMPVIDLIAALAQEIADHVLARSLGTAGRGDRNKIPGGRKLRVEAGIDGVQDSLLRIGSHFERLQSRILGDESRHPSPIQPPGYS